MSTTLRRTRSSTTTACDESEINRFIAILRRHVEARGELRHALRAVLIQYLKFSPHSRRLINDLIETCISLNVVERLEVAIDILSSLGSTFQEFVSEYLQNDIRQFSRLFPNRTFRPNDDYWYVMLRALGRCQGRKDRSLAIISVCQDEPSRGVAEGVVEALGDLGTSEAIAVLQNMATTHQDQFIRSLATDILQDLN